LIGFEPIILADETSEHNHCSSIQKIMQIVSFFLNDLIRELLLKNTQNNKSMQFDLTQ
jgi:hypothetical protein